MFLNDYCAVYVDSNLLLPQSSTLNPILYWHNTGAADSALGGTALLLGHTNLSIAAGSNWVIQNCFGHRYYLDVYCVQP